MSISVSAAIAVYGPIVLGMLQDVGQVMTILNQASGEGRDHLTDDEKAVIDGIVDSAESAYFKELAAAKERLGRS